MYTIPPPLVHDYVYWGYRQWRSSIHLSRCVRLQQQQQQQQVILRIICYNETFAASFRRQLAKCFSRGRAAVAGGSCRGWQAILGRPPSASVWPACTSV